jgi:hypothetical protein
MGESILDRYCRNRNISVETLLKAVESRFSTWHKVCFHSRNPLLVYVNTLSAMINTQKGHVAALLDFRGPMNCVAQFS